MYFGNQPVPDNLLAQLRHFPELQSLNLGDCRVTGGQLKYLAGLNRLASLVLSGTAVDDDGLEKYQSAGVDRVAEPPRYGNLGRRAGPRRRASQSQGAGPQEDASDRRGREKLKPLTAMKWLLLAETSLSDAGLDDLASLKSLGRLTINKTEVTKDGIAKLKRAIPGLTVDSD